MHLGTGKMSDAHPGLINVCEQCQLPFRSLAGGMCSVCKRMLCKRHLLGLTGRFGLKRPARIVCKRCRQGVTRK